LKDLDGVLIDTVGWRAGNRVDKLSALDDRGYLITDMLADIIPVGRYAVEITASNGSSVGRVAFPMNVPALARNGLGLSTIELAYQITPDTAGRFVKNGYRVMPNPSGQFRRSEKKISYYAEAYGLDTSATAESSFTVTSDILASDGSVVGTASVLSYRKPGESAVIVAEVPVDTLLSGDYNLKVTLRDGNSMVSTARDFSVVVSREGGRDIITRGILRDYPEATNIVTDEDARKFRNEITYIATPKELKLFDGLVLSGKALFQKDFWSRRDPDTTSRINEFMIEHYRRYEYVNASFGRFRGERAGWKSDRGRVYMMYGEPSEIERFPSSLESRAWERWWYHGMEGGVYFIFVDYETADDFILVHSTKRDEIKDSNWEDKIRVSTYNR